MQQKFPEKVSKKDCEFLRSLTFRKCVCVLGEKEKGDKVHEREVKSLRDLQISFIDIK